jgi:hypothetical protein
MIGLRTFGWLAGLLLASALVACGGTSDDTGGQESSGAGNSGAAGTDMRSGEAGAGEPGGGEPSSGEPGGGEPAGGQAGGAAPGGGGADAGTGSGTAPGVVPSARGGCNLNSGFPGDEACLTPPDPDKGFQIHIGPNNYEDAAEIAKFIMEPGRESSECFMKKTANDRDIHHLVYELSGRPGTHHIINTLLAEDLPENWGRCRSFGPGGDNIGSLGGASRPHMPPMPVAPENQNLGIPLAAHTQAQHDMHYFNLTDQPILREFWMNIYYAGDTGARETPGRIAGLGGFSWNSRPIQPGTHRVYPYECAIDAHGRIIQLLGHTHKHGIRETAHIRRASGERIKVFEQYDYLEPQIFNFDSLTENPGFSSIAPGAYTGLLEVFAGDTLEWECEVHNTSAVALRYTNEVETGEMCNIWGMTVGPTISCFLP